MPRKKSTKTIAATDNANGSLRVIRLNLFFAPYPQFVLETTAEQSTPVRLDKRAGRPSRLLVHQDLLSPSAPEWVEEAILRCALLLERSRTVSKGLASFGLLNAMLIRKRIRSPKPVPVAAFRPAAAGLRQVWTALRSQYFPDHPDLDRFSVVWSDRGQRSTLACCNAERRRVEVACALKGEPLETVIEPLLYHEMCHAFLGPPKKHRGRRVIHGCDFKVLEKRHPAISELNRWIKEGGWKGAVRTHNRQKRTRNTGSGARCETARSAVFGPQRAGRATEDKA